MAADYSAAGPIRVAAGNRVGAERAVPLRGLAILAGLSASVLFVVIGLGYELQLYGDGSIFSYAIAVRDA